MPSARKHLRAAERHYDAALTAGANDVTRSWGAVALFYAAHQLVHAVLDGESTLAADLRHPTSHGSSSAGLGTTALVARLYKSIDTPYRSLFAVGKAVRYDGLLVTSDDFRGYIDDDFRDIVRWADAKMRAHGRRELPAWLQE